jgi:hypothetical protein
MSKLLNSITRIVPHAMISIQTFLFLSEGRIYSLAIYILHAVCSDGIVWISPVKLERRYVDESKLVEFVYADLLENAYWP